MSRLISIVLVCIACLVAGCAEDVQVQAKGQMDISVTMEGRR